MAHTREPKYNNIIIPDKKQQDAPIIVGSPMSICSDDNDTTTDISKCDPLIGKLNIRFFFSKEKLNGTVETHQIQKNDVQDNCKLLNNLPQKEKDRIFAKFSWLLNRLYF